MPKAISNTMSKAAGKAKLGGLWNFNLVNITAVSRGAGVSEHYWK